MIACHTCLYRRAELRLTFVCMVVLGRSRHTGKTLGGSWTSTANHEQQIGSGYMPETGMLSERLLPCLGLWDIVCSVADGADNNVDACADASCRG